MTFLFRKQLGSWTNRHRSSAASHLLSRRSRRLRLPTTPRYMTSSSHARADNMARSRSHSTPPACQKTRPADAERHVRLTRRVSSRLGAAAQFGDVERRQLKIGAASTTALTDYLCCCGRWRRRRWPTMLMTRPRRLLYQGAEQSRVGGQPGWLVAATVVDSIDRVVSWDRIIIIIAHGPFRDLSGHTAAWHCQH